MKKILGLVVAAVLLFSFTAAYAQDAQSYLNENKYILAEKISKLPGFSYPSSSINPIDAQTLRSGLNLLPPERIEQVMSGFKDAVAFFYNENTGITEIILVLMELKDKTAADDFIKAEEEVLKAKDTAFKTYIKSSAYDTIDIAGGEKAFISRKVITEGENEREVTVIVAARNNYLIECNYLQGKHSNDQLKKDVLDIWQVMAK